MSVVGLGITSPCYAETPTNTSIDEISQESRDMIQSLETYSAERRDEAIQKIRVALDNMDKRIDELESAVDDNWDKMDKAARDAARDSLKALHKQRTEVAEWYGRLTSSSADAWGRAKNGFSSAYMAFHAAWEKSEKTMGSDK
jgi:hypothetical protein